MDKFHAAKSDIFETMRSLMFFLLRLVYQTYWNYFIDVYHAVKTIKFYRIVLKMLFNPTKSDQYNRIYPIMPFHGEKSDRFRDHHSSDNADQFVESNVIYSILRNFTQSSPSNSIEFICLLNFSGATISLSQVRQIP